MELELDPEKTLHENAGAYYDQAKRIRKKIEGARKALEASRSQLARAKSTEKDTVLEKKRDRQWFEKYHWLKTRNGFLAIAGRDAKGNEQVVKKQMKPNDLFFHADIQGAAATLLIDGQKASDDDRTDAARLAAVFSKAWTAGLGAVDVYCVKPDQVKTAAKAGEFLAKGSFVIEGKREWFKDVPLEARVTLVGGLPAFSATEGVALKPGKTAKSDLAKKVKAKLGGELDEWVQLLPQGGEIAS